MAKPPLKSGKAFEKSKADKERKGSREGSKREERMDMRQKAASTVMGKGMMGAK